MVKPKSSIFSVLLVWTHQNESNVMYLVGNDRFRTTLVSRFGAKTSVCNRSIYWRLSEDRLWSKSSSSSSRVLENRFLRSEKCVISWWIFASDWALQTRVLARNGRRNGRGLFFAWDFIILVQKNHEGMVNHDDTTQTQTYLTPKRIWSSLLWDDFRITVEERLGRFPEPLENFSGRKHNRFGPRDAQNRLGEPPLGWH